MRVVLKQPKAAERCVKMEVIEFYRRLRKHCTQQTNGNGENCQQCKFRMFCYTPPINLSDVVINQMAEDLVRGKEQLKKTDKTTLFIKKLDKVNAILSIAICILLIILSVAKII